MDLPNYFLADLPDTSTLTPELITDACTALKQNRAKFLAPLTTEEIIQIISGLARDWLDHRFEYRKLALEKGPGHTGFSRETIDAGLDNFFAQITPEHLHALLVQDLGSARRLDQFVASEPERAQNRSSIAQGPELLAHITGGVLPNPTLTSMILGLLVRSAQFIKCATGTAFIPRMFAHSLYAAHPKLGACLEIAEWKGGRSEFETALFKDAQCVTVTGSDETLGHIRQAVPPQVRLVEYGHKLSLAFVTRDALNNNNCESLAAALADDVSAWDQLGCLSPHAIYAENRGAIEPERLAELLASQLAAREKVAPRGALPADVAGAIATRRMAYQVRASADPGTKIWQSGNSTAWTVVYDATPEFQTSCLHRFIHVKPVDQLEHLLASLEPLRGKISTIALAAPTKHFEELSAKFAALGVTRICRPGRMQVPPLSWRHDGRPSLAELVTWTDIEF